MYCQQCGYENSNSSKFCANCGAELIGSSSQAGFHKNQEENSQNIATTTTVATVIASAQQSQESKDKNSTSIGKRPCQISNTNTPKNSKLKKLTIASIVAVLVVLVLVVILIVVCVNYSQDNSSSETQNAETNTSATQNNANDTNSADNTNSENSSATNQNQEQTNQQPQEQQQSEEQPQAPQLTEAEIQAQKVANLTQQLKNEGYTVVAEGEVRQHYDSSYGHTNITYFVKSDSPCEVSGWRAGGYTTVTSQMFVVRSKTDGTFRNEDEIAAYFSPLVGKRVLIGFTDGGRNVGFNTDVPCSLTQHSQSECELLNSGRLSLVYYMRVIEL